VASIRVINSPQSPTRWPTRILATPLR
jgi:hypothetical protein